MADVEPMGSVVAVEPMPACCSWWRLLAGMRIGVVGGMRKPPLGVIGLWGCRVRLWKEDVSKSAVPTAPFELRVSIAMVLPPPIIWLPSKSEQG
jgi:hypothetical protein